MATDPHAGGNPREDLEGLRNQRTKAEQFGDTAEVARLDEQITQAEQKQAGSK